MKFRPLLIAAALIWGGCQNSGNAPEAADAPETAPVEEAVVNVYTHRHYDTDKALFKQFEEQTGIKVNVKKDGADKLIQLLQAEGANSPADLLITVDAGRLHYARTLDLLSPVASETLSNQVPANLCDPEGYWYALTKRARVVVYAPDRVDASELSTYDDLASEKWAGRIFVRSSTNIYNQSLMASIIANQGEEKALAWAKSVVGNMAAPPKGNDRDQVKQVALGNGDLAIVNTYYIGKLLNSDNELEREAGQKVAVFFPNQETTGTHINVSAMGMAKHAPNRENAQRLMEFLTGVEAQSQYAKANYEYPANPAVEPSELLKSWGPFTADTINLNQLGVYNEKAVEIFGLAGWD